MANLGIDNNLIDWTQLFITEKLVELLIDGFTNPRQNFEIRIL